MLVPALLLATACTSDALLDPVVEVEANPEVFAKKTAPSLQNTIEYVFAGHLQTFDAQGRLLVWVGDIDGDIQGEMKWWSVLGGGPPNMPEAAHVGHYEARWEIWDGATLLLAGNSAGSTAQPPGKDGIWRGKGKVTETGAGFEEWNGRSIFEGGNVDWAFPYSGEGMFRIN
jgi:hypothetical protein